MVGEKAEVTLVDHLNSDLHPRNQVASSRVFASELSDVSADLFTDENLQHGTLQ